MLYKTLPSSEIGFCYLIFTLRLNSFGWLYGTESGAVNWVKEDLYIKILFVNIFNNGKIGRE